MLKKFVAIKNVGRFKNSASQGNPELARHVLIWGANGYGKTTLCAILRSLQTGDPTYLTGRKTLGAAGELSVELLVDDGVRRFDRAGWSGPLLQNLAIFDGTFVAENVHSGEAVELNQKRNLYRVIIGQEGVDLAKEDARLAGESRRLTGEITAIAKTIQQHLPPGMTLTVFLAIDRDPDIDAKIAEQERTLEAVKQAGIVQARQLLSEIAFPNLPDGFMSLLARTVDDVAENAEQRLSRHIADHRLVEHGEAWIAEGMAHANGETCPFCGQDTRDLPLIAAYRAIFSTGYKALKADIVLMKNQVREGFGVEAVGNMTTAAERNRTTVEFWRRYCQFDPDILTISGTEAVLRLGDAMLALLDRKANAPLECVNPDHAFIRAKDAYEAALVNSVRVNDAILAVNALITTKKVATGAADVRATEAELAQRRAIKKRHEHAVAALCADHSRLNEQKNETDKNKIDIRGKLEAHTARVVTPYEKRINDYLDAFNAGFRISATKHGYPGGIATSSYQIVINATAVDLGDGDTPTDRPCFKNTLSAGDRTTLALAFFLANLDRDAGRKDKIVVFDDPFSSQDAFRRLQTVHEIRKTGRECAQVVVLSHDATFLKQVWDKSSPSERVSLQIVDARAQGAKIQSMDLTKACLGRMASEIDDLLAFLTTGAGRPLDLIKKMRVVLETHCQTAYVGYFAPTDWLGEIVKKIRVGEDDHPAKALYDELDQINDYTKQYHHGEDLANSTPDQIDDTELSGFARRTLRVVNALQA